MLDKFSRGIKFDLISRRKRSDHKRRLSLESLEPRRLLTGDLRTHLDDEGYLHYVGNSSSGHELTGYIGMTSPSGLGPQDNSYGYDYSSNQLSVHLVFATIGGAVPLTGVNDHSLDTTIARWFDYANAVYAQAGISVVHSDAPDTFLNFNNTSQNGSVIPTIANLTIAVAGSDTASNELTMMRHGRGNSDDVNVYVVVPADWRDVNGNLVRVDAHTVIPADQANGNLLVSFQNNEPLNDGIVIKSDSKVSTLAHELGHMLLGSSKPDPATPLVYSEYLYTPFPGTNNAAHAHAKNDIMSSGLTRAFSRSDVYANPRSGFNATPAQVGLRIGDGIRLGSGGNLTTRNSLAAGSRYEFVFLDKDHDLHLSAGERYVSEAYAMQSSRYVHERGSNSASDFGDRVDFAFVEDNSALEGLPLDPHDDPLSRVDSMVWTLPGIYAPEITNRPEIGGFTENFTQLPSGAFGGASFNAIDVISLTARYGDMDGENDTTLGSQRWSEKQSALDYKVETSFDGVTWTPAVYIQTFKDGWTDDSKAEDYVTRWLANPSAKYVRITSIRVGLHDGNTQIDAIIVGHLPEIQIKVLGWNNPEGLKGVNFVSSDGRTTAPLPGTGDPEYMHEQAWTFSYSVEGLGAQLFDIEVFASANGLSRNDSLLTLTVTSSGIYYGEELIDSSDGTADGEHTIDFGDRLQTTVDRPFLIAQIDPDTALDVADTTEEAATSEGIYFDGVNIHVYGSSDPDAVSFSGSAPVRVDSSTVVDGMVGVSLTTNAGASNAHEYVLDNFTIHVGNPSQVATVADYQYSFGDTDIHTYGGGDYIDTFAAPGFIATVHGGTGDDSLMASGLVFYDINTDMLLGAAKPGEVDLFGQDGDDLLWAADGNNNLYGGLGDDQYRFAEPYSGLVSAYGTVGIFENVGEGQDTVDFNRLLYITSVLTIDLSSTDQQSAGSQFSVTFNDGHTLENLIGTDYDDQLTGNDQDNLIQGGHGNDTIFATTGNDILYGATQSAPQYLTGDDTFVFSDLVDGAAADQIFAGYDGVQTLDFSPLASRQISLDPTLQGVWQSVIDGQLDLNLQGNFTVNAPTGGITPIVADSSTTDPQTLEGGDGAVFQVDGNQSQVTIQLTSGATNATLQLGAIAQPVLIELGGQIVQIDAATGNATLNLSVDESGLHIDRFDTFGPSSASTITAHLVSGDAGKLAWSNDSGDTTFTAPDVTTLLPTFDVWAGTLAFSADQHASVVLLDGADAHLLLSGTQHIDSLETGDGATATISGDTLTVANSDYSSRRRLLSAARTAWQLAA